MGDLIISCHGQYANGNQCKNVIHIGGVPVEGPEAPNLDLVIGMARWTREGGDAFCAWCSPRRVGVKLADAIDDAWDQAQTADTVRDLFEILESLHERAEKAW